MEKQLSIFFNTVHLSGNKLYDAVRNIKKQNERIYQIMKLSGKKLSPFDVHEEYEQIFSPTPITSIRRAMTTLTDDGRLYKLAEMTNEKYGKPNHLWVAV